MSGRAWRAACGTAQTADPAGRALRVDESRTAGTRPVGSTFGDVLREVSERFVDLSRQDQREVAGLQPGQRGVDGGKLAADLVDLARADRALQALAQQAHHLAVGAAALGRVLCRDHIIEGLAQDRGLVADVGIAPVARAADDHRALLRRRGCPRPRPARMAVPVLWP